MWSFLCVCVGPLMGTMTWKILSSISNPFLLPYKFNNKNLLRRFDVIGDVRILKPELKVWCQPGNFLLCWGCLFWFPQPVKTDQRVGSAWSPSLPPSLPPSVFKTHFLTRADLSAHSGLAVRSISPLRYYKLLLKHPAWLYKLFVDKISVVKTTKTLCGGKIYKYHLDNQKISHHPGAMTMTPHIVKYSQY